MYHSSIFVIKLKKIIVFFVFCIIMVFMIIFLNSNYSSAKSGLSLWANSIVPSLLPFLIAAELLSQTFLVSFLSKVLGSIMRPLFNVPGEGSFAFIMGIISGYPVGAKVVSELYKNGSCTLVEAERLLAFTNNSGPLFILSTIGISFFRDSRTGVLLLITHVLSALTVGFLFRFWKCRTSIKNTTSMHSSLKSLSKPSNLNNLRLSNLGTAITSAIMNSIHTVLLIGGFVLMFSVIISMLVQSHILPVISRLLEPIFDALNINLKLCSGTISGIIEITNGIQSISLVSIKEISQSIVVTSFLLGFGGISVLLQVLSITSKVGISIKTYIIGKVLQGVIAALYTYIILNNFSFFNLDVL